MKKFLNASPITSAWKAICLLHHEWGDSTVRELATFPGQAATIDVHHFGGPYDSLSRIDYFQVAPEIADYLKAERLVIGKPAWGYRSTFTWVATDALEEAYHQTIAPRFPSNTWHFAERP